MFVDAKGKACPMPVIMAKKELDAGCGDLTVAVDNKIAVQNLSRLAADHGMQVTVENQEGAFLVHFSGDGKTAEPPQKVPESAQSYCGPLECGYSVFIGKDHMGEGNAELGYNLIKMAIYTLAKSDAVPASVLFMNSGVKLPTGDEQQILDSLNELIGKGTEVLVCGTCLNYYGLTDKLKVGTASNMYDIVSRMQSAAKVITL